MIPSPLARSSFFGFANISQGFFSPIISAKAGIHG
jgi:hypothetical protein